MLKKFEAHQRDKVPGVPAAEGLAAAQSDDDREEDEEGAEVGPHVGLHSLLDRGGEGEHAHHTEGEHHLDCHNAEHLCRTTAFPQSHKFITK